MATQAPKSLAKKPRFCFLALGMSSGSTASTGRSEAIVGAGIAPSAKVRHKGSASARP